MSKKRTGLNPELWVIMDEAQRKIEAVLKHPVTVYFKVRVHEVTTDDIIRAVCEHFNLTWAEIIATREHPQIVAKQIFLWLARIYTRSGQNHLAKIAGLTDHSNVSKTMDVMTSMVETANPEYIIPLNEIERKILSL